MANTNLISLLRKAGFKGEALKTAYGIALRESGGRSDAFNPNRSTGDQSYGLFQINMLGDLGSSRRKQYGLQSNEDLYDPLTNAKVAFRMSNGGRDFGAWGIGPNAYRPGAGYDTIKKYVDQFPTALANAPLQSSPVAPPSPVAALPQPREDTFRLLSEAIRSGRWSLDAPMAATLSLLAQQTPTTQVVPPATTKPTVKPTPKPGRGLASLKAGGGWSGSYNIALSLARLAKQNGLSVMSEKRDRKNTASGGVSDHWVGSKTAYAFDLSNGQKPTKEMDRTARQLLRLFGKKWDGKSPIVFNAVTPDGYRVQILYRTEVGGNHYNHIHIGVRKVS